MGRKNQVGIKYFSFDVDFFNDEKIEFTSARFGIKGEIIAIRLLCKIYRNGYFTHWDDDESALLAKRAGDGISPSLVSEVVKELVKRGFFDEALLNRLSILTSRGIQNRYFEATKRFKSVEVYKEFLLVDVSEMPNVHIITENVNINPENVNINQQKKRKEKKEKEIKVKEENDGGKPPTPSPKKNHFDFNSIVEHYHQKCPGMPRVTILNDSRKNTIKARLNEVGPDGVLKMIQNAGSSEFLNGKNERSWIASFDWLFKPANFAKVLEGNYINTKSNESFKPNDPRASAVEGFDERL